MFLKIMGRENCPDNDPRKTFRMMECVDADFCRDGNHVAVRVIFEDGDIESFPVLANAYLMNNDGLTVSSFGAATYKRSERECATAPGVAAAA